MKSTGNHLKISSSSSSLKTILITRQKNVKDEMKIINTLFEMGLDELHINKPSYNNADLTKYIRAIDKSNWHKIVLCQNYEVASELGLRGIVIKNEKLKSWFFRFMNLRKIKKENPELKIYTTFSSTSAMLKYAHLADEVFLEPVFTVNTYVNKVMLFNKQKLEESITSCPIPVIASGGVTETKVGEIRELGFAGFAVYSAVWKADNPIESFKLFIEEKNSGLQSVVS